jgi:hypothetical protein
VNTRKRNLYLLTGLAPLLRDELLAEAVELVWELLAVQEAFSDLS